MKILPLVNVPTVMLFMSATVSAADGSRFYERLETTDYPAISDRNHSVDLRWNFSRDRQYAYEYRQEALFILKTRGFPESDPQIMTQKLHGNGTLALASRFNDAARLTLEIDTRTDAFLPDGRRQTINNKLPQWVIENFSDKGDFAARDPAMDSAIRQLLSLPAGALRPGETAALSTALPINVNNTRILVPAEITIELVGLLECKKHRCAELRTSVRVTDHAPPAGGMSHYTIDLDSHGRAWFDLDEGRLVESLNAALLTLNAEVPPMPQNAREVRELEERPYLVHIVMERDDFIHLRYRPGGAVGEDRLTPKKYRRQQPGAD